MKPYLLVLAVAVGLSGCTLFDRQEKRINYTENLTSIWGGPTLVTDAKQRAIINVPANVGVGNAKIGPDGKPDPNYKDAGADGVVKNHPTRIICAEPSPDVAQAISAAFTAAAEVDAKLAAAPAAGAAAGANQQIAGSGSVGSAYASSIAQLGERLATVALLRDKMYRACEAYQNGAISDTSYTLMLSRFDKTMTSLLSSEMAASAFGRNLAALGGSASTRGVDPKELAEAKEGAKSAAKKLSEVAALPDTDTTKKEALTKAGGDLDAAVSKLADLELQAAATAAQSGPGSTGVIGQIVGRTQTDADAVARINANFLDDDASGSIIDACITALDRNRATLSPQDAATASQYTVQLADARAAAKKANDVFEDAKRNSSGNNAPDEAAGLPSINPDVAAADLQRKQAAVAEAEEKQRQFMAAATGNNISLSSACSTILTTANNSTSKLTVTNDGSATTSEVTGGVIGLLQQNKLALRNVEADIAKIQFAAAKANAETEKKRIEGCMLAAGATPDATAKANLWKCLGVTPAE